MKARQFLMLVLSGLLGWAAGLGLLPLLPLYAAALGGSTTVIGYYLAATWLMISLGSVIGGWLRDRTGRCHIWMVVASVGSASAIWVMSLTRTLWQLAIPTGLLWLCGGVYVALSRVMISHSMAREQRGVALGLLALCTPLGGLLGNALAGLSAELWGYPAMLRCMAALSAGGLVLLLLVRESHAPANPAGAATSEPIAARQRSVSYLLAISSLVIAGAYQVGQFSRSLAMSGLGYGPGAISSTGVVAALVVLPLSPVVGHLSDRYGRKGIAMAAAVIAMMGGLALYRSNLLWHFWAAMALLAFNGCSETVRYAWAADLADSGRLGQAVAAMVAATSMGEALGYAAAGQAMASLGVRWTPLLAGLIGLAAVPLLLLVPVRRR